MKEKIIKLRSQGKSYNQIRKILNCSKSLISYHCGTGQKEKSLLRQRKNRRNIEGILSNKINKFLRNRIRNFKRKKSNGKIFGKTNSTFSYKEAKEKIINNPICFLTGRKIDLYNSSSYNLDHIISTAKGGENTLPNMGLTSRDANQGKSDLSVNEFIQLCIEVCNHNGYIVKKK